VRPSSSLIRTGRYNQVMDPPHRWILPDLASALEWTKERNGQGIRCTLALAGEYARDREGARAGFARNIACLRAMAGDKAGASLSVKPSSLGGLTGKDACREHLVWIAREAAGHGIPLEIDMEGKGYVDLTLGAAVLCRKDHPSVTVALQSYLDRTPGDIRRMAAERIRIRLVKGAYLGDTRDFGDIERRTREDVRLLGDLGAPFSLGTHDPIVIGEVQEEFGDARDLVEFGFLMGLSGETRGRLAGEGWRVSEYVPFGPGGEGYILRRERYLRDLALAGRAPAP
jgi:proline dehydrogenase